MRVLGITGGIGSGKSSVAKILEDLGARIIDSDLVAREVLRKGEEGFNELVDYFGEKIINSAGELDRKLLGQIVFANKAELKILNRISHKFIIKRILEMLNNYTKESFGGIVVIEIPIPFDNDLIKYVDKVWTVSSDMDSRIKRVMHRNGFTEEDAIKRIKSQKGDEDYISIADKVLENNGSMEELKSKIKKVLYKLQ